MPAGTLHQRDGAAPGKRHVEQPTQRVKLGLALEQLLRELLVPAHRTAFFGWLELPRSGSTRG